MPLISKLKVFPEILGSRGIRWLILAVIASLSLALLEYGIAGFLQLFLVSLGYVDPKMIPTWLQGMSRVSITGLSLLLIAIGVFRATSMFLAAYATEYVHELLSVRLRLATIYEMLRYKDEHFLSAADVQSRIGELFPKARHFMFSAVNLFIIVTQAGVLFLAMIFTAWKEWLVGMIGLAIAGVLVSWSNRAAARNANVIPDIQAHLSKGVERSARNWLFIRISRTQSEEHTKLVGHVLDYFKAVVRASEFVNLMLGLPPLFGIVLFAFIIFLSRSVFETGPSQLIIFLYLFLRLVQHLGNAAREWGQCTTYREQFRRALQIFFNLPKDARTEALIPYELAQRGRKMAFSGFSDTHTIQQMLREQHQEKTQIQYDLNESAPSLVFNQVAFTYPKSDSNVLENISFEMQSGQIYGITGPSGSGKSTLLLLTLGMLEPSQGSILVQGKKPKDYFLRNSHRLGYVGAEPFLIEGSIRDNLLYGHAMPDSVSDSEIQTVIRQVQLTSVLESKGLDYRLDENGSGLSTGQKQRLALARALIRKPLILILDEASANLDNDTEAEIAQQLENLKGKTTVLIVSHRAGLLKPAARQIQLVAGRMQLSTPEALNS